MYPDLFLVIDGEHIGANRRNSEPVINPATGARLADLPHASDADLDRALTAAEHSFESWRQTSPLDRSKILRGGADIIRTRIDQIARILTMEQGKPLDQARAEIVNGAETLDWYAEEGRRTYGRIVPARAFGTMHMVIREPVGVSIALTPWNFPCLTPARKIGAALAAGCTLILKAAEETPGTALAMVDALHEAGLPPGVLNLVSGVPADISRRLITSPVTRKISFTGSVPVGKALTQLAAAGMKRTSMELGGHAPVLVFNDVDVDKAVDLLVTGKYRNAGQVCISPTRFYVQDRIFDHFADRFTERAAKIAVGDGLKDGVVMGPLANFRRIESMDRFVADARQRGADIRTGGERIGNAGFFYAPTVVTDAPDDSMLMTEEPFGPVASIVRFSETDEVIARANSLPFGLASYAFTSSDRTALAVMNGLKAGMIGLNSLGISNPETPFGGVRDSGHGQEGGVEGLDAYLDVKFIAQAPSL